MSTPQAAILIADEMHPSLFTMLDEAGYSYEYQPTVSRADLLARIGPFEGLIIRSKTTVDTEMLAAAPHLRYIGRAGAGLDLIDVAATEARRIQVFHAGTGNRDAVAEHVLGMLLALFNNLLKADREVRQGTWDREGNRGIELMGKTVGLFGYGNNGQATARRLSGFGCRVLAYDKYRTDYGDAYAEAATVAQIMAEADVLSLHVPLTTDTRQWINDAFIEQFSKPFFLVNASRGEVASLTAVVAGLQSGKVRGACLDVLENEKLKTLTPAQQAAFDYLRQSDRVVLTPHIAGWTHESYVRINQVLVDQLLAMKKA
ncbi:D-isomer specific 2-hydroxyacid dehydrogenase NAD-binding protein [Fibrella aestuarina BUZ 2]|uniref:D-isomer specific 2-hydroxyacid dehydrogenase NAD-binding protein n=1 Tax=Fibrella aestuarina BUZ 2 TaxID=1166018 RepID=I0KFB5_9BACT|nr:2-hydroxyacid dehydrogenase [Fibrella aestuarina]CCH02818.1 D-isomer specific 2-hydroxyacid dehydrogenase NAD-binding protein [Fibrella aestuarina BUZ 2]